MYLGIDGTNWCHVLWHACRDATPEAVAVTFTRRVECLLEFLSPKHAVVAFDGRASFRKEIEPSYKANRTEKDASLRVLLDAAPRAVSAVATIAVQDGFEADDCLATIAAIGSQHGEKTVLATPDKDCRQCLRYGTVNLLRSFKLSAGRVTDPDWYTEYTLAEEFGLRPGQWPDFQALVGDPTDGISGCPGWGKVTAQKALASRGTLAALLADPWQAPCSAKQRDALFAFKPHAETVLQLVTLTTNVPAVYDAVR